MAEKKPQLLQFLEISLLQRKATALTLLGSGKLLRTEEKCSFISGGQRKNVVCPDIIFVPPKAAGSHFCGSASWSSGSPQLCCQSRELGAPKGRPRLSKNPWKKQGRAPGKCLCCGQREQKIAPPSAVTCLYPSLHISPLT